MDFSKGMLKYAIRFDGKKLNCVYAKDTRQAQRCIARILRRSTDCLGCDLETGRKAQFLNDDQAGLDPYRSFISLAQFYDGIDTLYLFDCYYLDVCMLRPIFAAKRVIFHNAIFDVSHLIHNGITDVRADDSMILYNMYRTARYVDMDQEEEGEGINVDFITKKDRYGGSLKAVTAKILGISLDKSQQKSNWTDRPLSKEQLVYGGCDAYLTYEIGKVLSRRLVEDKMGKVYALNRKAIGPICRMILHGCEIDVEAHEKHIKKWTRERNSKLKLVRKHMGNDINLNSYVQLSKWFEKHMPKDLLENWERSEKTSCLKTDAKTLNRFSHIPYVTPLMEYKKLEKLLSTYGESLLNKICPVTKRLHGSFTLGFTATGRLSSRNPNLQNLPRGVDIRGIFKASEGHVLVGADYGQIELRTAAYITKDKTMIGAYDDGLDLHKLIVHMVTGKAIDKVTKEERQLGKAINFGLLFGMGAPGLIEYAKWNYGVDLSMKESRHAVDTFRKTWSGYTRWQKLQRDRCAKLGYVRTRLGKRRKLADNFIYTCSVNHPVQGTAAELVISALCIVDKNAPSCSSALCNCIHDEFLLEVPKRKKKKAQRILRLCMEKAMQHTFPGVTMRNLVDVKNGPTWGDCH